MGVVDSKFHLFDLNVPISVNFESASTLWMVPGLINRSILYISIIIESHVYFSFLLSIASYSDSCFTMHLSLSQGR
jgi:hypothetical protein